MHLVSKYTIINGNEHTLAGCPLWCVPMHFAVSPLLYAWPIKGATHQQNVVREMQTLDPCLTKTGPGHNICGDKKSVASTERPSRRTIKPCLLAQPHYRRAKQFSRPTNLRKATNWSLPWSLSLAVSTQNIFSTNGHSILAGIKIKIGRNSHSSRIDYLSTK